MNNMEMMGRRIKVEIPRNQNEQQPQERNNNFRSKLQGEQKGEESNNVIVRNLPFTVDENKLQETFEGCGEILRVRIIKGEDGQSRGFGFVDFSQVEFARAAINKSGERVNGREIHVDYSIPRDKRENQNNRGGYQQGGNRGGFQGGNRGGQRQNSNFQGEIVDL